MNLIQELKENERPFGLMSEEMQEKAREIGAEKFIKFHGEGFGTNNGHLEQVFTYRVRPDYAEKPEKANAVFASTTDSEKDLMNNVVGVTAHCQCGNVFCDDVVHGKSQHAEKPEIVECEIEEDMDRLWFMPPDEDSEEPRDLICDVSRYPDFIGFKFEDGVVSGVPVRYLLSCGHFNTFAFKELAEVKVLHATAVLFRRQE